MFEYLSVVTDFDDFGDTTTALMVREILHVGSFRAWKLCKEHKKFSEATTNCDKQPSHARGNSEEIRAAIYIFLGKQQLTHVENKIKSNFFL